MPRFSNSAFILANWNLPNSCSIALALCNGSSESSESLSAMIVPVKLPAFLSTIPPRSIPNPVNISFATLVGLIIDANADLSALAPSEALIPPSRIAVK